MKFVFVDPNQTCTRVIIWVKRLLPGLASFLVAFSLCADASRGRLENADIAWQWDTAAGRLTSVLRDKHGGASFVITSECFQLVLNGGRVVKASDFKRVENPHVEELPPEADAPRSSSHFEGRQMTVKFSDAQDHLSADWKVSLREGGSYVQQKLELRTTDGDIWVKELVLFEQQAPEARTIGSVDGSPVLLAGTFYCGYEHPMARNMVSDQHQVRCSFVRNAVLKEGETLSQSFVIGVAPEGQLRRGFLAYIERERAHPYRPFLHYNSWFDIAWDKRKFDEAESLDAIRQFGSELVEKRGVAMCSFLFDDGWDDNRTLWKFHNGFPNGFAAVEKAAEKVHASIGVWISPFGGYDQAKQQRLAYGVRQGFETNASGFSLAGPKYYERFREICLQMVRQYGVNMFKFDGLAASDGSGAGAGSLTRDGDAMLRLIGDLRRERPDIYISQTVGTWPSPFWLLYVDSTWRGGADHDFHGKGSDRQRWMTYRDMETYRNVVERGPLYPLNSLMLHGIVYATNAAKLNVTSDEDFADEVHGFFGSGTQLQEMYITPKLLDQRNWDDLAEAAKWSRANSDVLVDTHWIGGDPGKGEVYGWASWKQGKGIVALRNPDDKAAIFTADAKEMFELPSSGAETFHLRSPWKDRMEQTEITLQAGKPRAIDLRPFEVLVLETE
ncbi:MAG: enterotoxin [Verrucomicrobiota bacterium]|jgi:hypothetical protein